MCDFDGVCNVATASGEIVVCLATLSKVAEELIFGGCGCVGVFCLWPPPIRTFSKYLYHV